MDRELIAAAVLVLLSLVFCQKKPLTELRSGSFSKLIYLRDSQSPGFLLTDYLAVANLVYGSEASENGAAPDRWGSVFKESYYSRADGAEISFEVHLPPAVEGQEAYPLLVVLKGGLQLAPSSDFPVIQVKPSRGGIWGYRAISGYDAMQVIAFMKRNYPVDPDRVYLVGFSAGASGAMHLASSYPDVFAAVLPMVAVGTDFPLVNFGNLPVAMHHGTDDWTSSICNARVQYEKMRDLGCPVVLREYPGVGHSVPKPHEPIADWLLEQTRNPSPVSIAHQCETPALGRSYWLHVREFRDPHRRAFVEASANFSGGRGTVSIRPENIQALTLDLELVANGEGDIEIVEIEGSRLSVKGTAKIQYCRLREGNWHLTADEESVGSSKRPYHAGAAANLYQGEPLLIVYGTGSEEEDRVDLLQAAALKLAACGGPVYYPMPNRFPVVADSALSSEQEENYNLILIGTPEENSAARAILPELPIAIQNDSLAAGKRPRMPLKDQVLSLLYPHPEYPQRFVYLLAPFADGEGLARFCEEPQRFLVGSEGFDRVSQGDLVVQDLENRIGRQMQFGKEWEWIDVSGSDTPIPARFGDRAQVAMEYLEIMRRKSGADFALWWGPADKGMWGYDFNFLQRYNPDFYTQADFRTQHRWVETMTGGVSGAEIEEIWERWGRNGELLSVPEMQIDFLVDREEYRVHIPMDLYIKLGQRKKGLNNPKPGPTISSEEVMAGIFQ